MSWTSQKMNSLSSTGSFMPQGLAGLVSFRVVGTELALASFRQLLGEPRGVSVEFLFFHPPQQRLPRYLACVRVALRQLPIYELFNRLCYCDFHALTMAQSFQPDNAQIAQGYGVLSRLSFERAGFPRVRENEESSLPRNCLSITPLPPKPRAVSRLRHQS